MKKLNATHFPLLDAVCDLGKAMIAETGDQDETQNPLDFYGEWFMESTSEAGYSEARKEGRLSCRAFANIVRVDPDDMKKVKQALGFRRDEYHEFALSETIVRALSKWTDIVPALHLIRPAVRTEVRGPFYPRQRELSLKLDTNWAFHCTIVGKRSPEVRAASIKLAGLFRVNQTDLGKIAATLLSQGAKQSDLEGMLADVVLESVRTDQRFKLALDWAQPA
jgi:hypothetical protein